jgi:hypothetical protein
LGVVPGNIQTHTQKLEYIDGWKFVLEQQIGIENQSTQEEQRIGDQLLQLGECTGMPLQNCTQSD